ncbi:MAG: DUF2304 domain-containing protein [Chitinophagales bacterium]
MEIRYFQIIIPIFSLLFILKQIKEYSNRKSGIYEAILIVVLWAGVMAVALFPDFFSELIAKVFGIKDNINAILFFAIGVLFYFQLQLFKMVKKQDETLTELVRKIALEHPQKINENQN